MSLWFIIIFCVFISMGLLGYSLVPLLYNRSVILAKKREKSLASKMEQVLPRSEVKKASRFLVLSPIVFGVACFFIFPVELRFFGILFGGSVGLILPGIYTKMVAGRTKRKFDDQLIDALMIMSSSFRGGLSLVQALEAVVEEMPDPIRSEFGTVLGENKMGVALEEALNHLYNRMPSTGLQQMITAILLARETGGNLPVVFTRIVNTIREAKKIQQNIDTLTLQGKIQGGVMAVLPIGFAFIVYTTNPRYMDVMLNSDIGRGMLIACVVLETIGGAMIIKISSIKEY